MEAKKKKKEKKGVRKVTEIAEGESMIHRKSERSHMFSAAAAARTSSSDPGDRVGEFSPLLRETTAISRDTD